MFGGLSQCKSVVNRAKGIINTATVFNSIVGSNDKSNADNVVDRINSDGARYSYIYLHSVQDRVVKLAVK